MPLKFEITGDNRNLLNSLDGARNGVRKAAKDIEQSGMGIEDMFKRIAASAGIAFSVVQAKQLAKSVMDVRGQFQQLEIAFSTMLQSEEKAQKLMSQLVETAAKTPFDLRGVSEGAKQLLAYGIAAEDVNETITRLGDIAAGLSIPLGDLVYLYGTTMTQGRMFTMDLRQFMGRGIPMAEELAKQFGVAKNEVAGLVTAGKVSADAVKKAIWSMTEEGSKFGGLMAKQSASITGQISNIEDAIDSMLNDIGKKSEGTINASLGGVSYIVENYEKIGKVLLQIAAIYGSYKAATIAYFAVQKVHTTWLKLEQTAHLQNALATEAEIAAKGKATVATVLLDKANKALNATMLTNPYVLVTAAIMSLVAAYTLYGGSLDETEKAQKRVNSIKEDAAKKVEEEKDKINELRKVAANEHLALKARQDAINQLNKIIPNYNAQLDATSGKYRENKAALDGYLQSLARKYELEGAKDQLKQIGKEIAQTRLEIRKAEQDVKGAKKLQGSKKVQSATDRLAAYNPAESQFLAANTSLAENKLDKANERLSVKLKERQLIYDTFGKDLIADAKEVAESTPPPIGNGSKDTPKGGKDDAAERAAKQIEEELRYQEELRKIRQEASDARRDAEIASIQNDAERERAEQDEQHQRNLRQIEEQANEMRKAIYEHNKKAWENAHKDSPYENTEAGKAGWMGLQLSEDQQATIDALMQKENAEYLRLVEQRYDAERQATLDFLKEYGDYEQQKLAITQEYEDKIAKASSVTEKASLGLQREKALKDLEKHQLEDSIDWAGVFNDLSGHTKEYLEGLRDQLQNILSTGNLPIDQMETIQGKIREINTAINEQGGMFSFANEQQREHTRRVQEAADAQERLNKALSDQSILEKEIADLELSLRDSLRSIDPSLAGIDFDEGWLDALGLDKQSDLYKKLSEQAVKLAKAEGNLAKAREKTSKAWGGWKKAEDGANEELKDAIARVAGNIKDWCNEFLGDLPDLLNEIGLGDAGEKVSQGLSGINNAANAAADFASGNFVGAALNAIKSVKDFGRAFGIGGGNAAEINRQLERLSDRNEILTTAIDRLTDTMNGKHGQSAIKTYETLAKQQKELEKNLQKQLQLQMSYTGAHHSFNKKWKGFSSSELNTFNSLFGTNWNGDLSTLTSEMASNLLGMADMMQKIADTGDYGDRVVERIKELAAQAGKAEEQVGALNEALTTTTKENVFDDYLSSLYDLADGSEDVMDDIAKNWQQKVNRMVVNNLIGEKMQSQLENWYEQLATLNRQRTNGEIGDSYYKQQLERLQNLYNSYVQQGQSQIEQFREMGIIKSIEETTEEALDYLDTIRSAFEQLVSDSETDIEAWGNNLRNSILQNLIQSKLLDEEFDKWANGWAERYSKLMSDLTDGAISQNLS